MSDKAGGGSPSHSAVPSVHEQESIVRSGDLHARWNLASTFDIDPQVAEEVFTDQNMRVRESLAGNYSAPPRIRATLSTQNDTLRRIVAWNPFAPPELKLHLPLREHASLAITRFLEDTDATDEQRQRLVQMYNAAVTGDDSETTLGDAWALIVSH